MAMNGNVHPRVGGFVAVTVSGDRLVSVRFAAMELRDRHIVLTGAAGGIGRGLAHRFAQEHPRALVLADRSAEPLEVVAGEIGATAVVADVGSDEGVRALVAAAEEAHGPIDVFFSNAGVPGPGGGPEAPDEEWQRTWEINVMSHVWAARAVLPGMIERGEGYLLSTASAAGLLTQISAAAYSVTKHAAVSFAEWCAITYHDAGIRVSVLCPQAVRTAMLDVALEADPVGSVPLLSGGVLEPADVAEVVVDAIREERFLILPHEVVGEYLALKGAQPERWLNGMRKLVRTAREQAARTAASGPVSP
jgi:NAD(P)-dependent dehydrogenase (short-subunit alcohol dehydrogenase family)